MRFFLSIILCLMVLFILGACTQAADPNEQTVAAPGVATVESTAVPGESPTLTPTAQVLEAPAQSPTEAPATEPAAEPSPVPTEAPVKITPAMPTPVTEPVPEALLRVHLEPIVSGLTAPIALVFPPDETGRSFVADQSGVIYVLDSRNRVQEEPFLDLRSRMVTLRESFDERGLLGLAFHPDYAGNGRFYVYYSAPLRPDGPAGWDHTSHVSEFTAVTPASDRANPDSERIILQIDQPQSNHNGGQIAFGPDGYLYIPLGDGGGANDVGEGHPPQGNGQDTSTLLGSILRLDVNTDGDAPYAIPADNPFVGQDGRDEIYAYGFRNPFRISFDDRDGALLAADVGQDLWEEINVVVAGGNYGWPIKEGVHCFDQQNPGVPLPACADTGANGEPLIDPVLVYANTKAGNGLGLAVIGGEVYQGRAIPSFQEHYIFGDWSTSFGIGDGRLFISPPPEPGQGAWEMQELVIVGRENGRLGEFLLSFGQNDAGEIFLLTSQNPGPTGNTGQIYLLRPEIMAESSLIDDPTDYLPLIQHYARLPSVAPIYHTLEAVQSNQPSGTHGEGHTWVTVYDGAEVNGQEYLRVFWDWGNYAWVNRDALHFTAPLSRLRGINLPGRDLTQQWAMVYRPVWVRSEPGVMEDETIAGYLDPWDVIVIYEEVEVEEDTWYRLGPDQWVHWDYVRLFELAERPEEVGPDEKWVQVNLNQQTIVAYEGDTPVYATLTATGRNAYPTQTGLFRVWSKLPVGPMRWADSNPPYSLANVPWIMYFNQDQALHGTYWHDLFGSVRSAGCVNLSPHDAHWFFHWAEPAMPAGERVLYLTEDEPTLWVWVYK